VSGLGKAGLAETGPRLVRPEKCPLCGSARLQTRFDLRYSWQDSQTFVPAEYLSPEMAFVLRGCQDCGFSFSSPQPNEEWLSQLYGKTSDSYFTPLGEGSPERQAFYRRVQTAVMERGIEKGRVLDIGCGTGEALASWREGFVRHGVEPSRFAAERARATAGADVHVGTLETARYPSGYFDVVTAFDVLEHLPDPRRLLQEVARVLRPGGLLVVETGNIHSLNARLAAGHWYYVRLPGHLSFFGPSTLRRVLDETGYHAPTIMPTHHGGAGLAQLLGYAKAMTRHLLLRGIGPRVLALPIFRSRNTEYSIPYFRDHMLAIAATSERARGSLG
jgi:SAM-dependent methyltransferase